MRFNKYYMMRNRPVVVRGMASSWGATQKWTDFEYLKESAGTSTSLVSLLTATRSQTDAEVDWSRIKPHKVPVTLEKALNMIESNGK